MTSDGDEEARMRRGEGDTVEMLGDDDDATTTLSRLMRCRRCRRQIRGGRGPREVKTKTRVKREASTA